MQIIVCIWSGNLPGMSADRHWWWWWVTEKLVWHLCYFDFINDKNKPLKETASNGMKQKVAFDMQCDLWVRSVYILDPLGKLNGICLF